MRLIALVLYYLTISGVNCKFFSILYELGMTNPIIIGRQSDLKTKELFNLMKDVMSVDQTISLTTTIRNDSLQNSPGIMLCPDKIGIENFYGQKANRNIQNPWIIVGKQSQKYSRIDEPLYELENGVLWEHFEFKSIRKSRELAKLYGNELKWAPNVPKKFFERRGNFENLTLLAMTEAELSYNELPKELKEVANVSELIPNTYEVTNNFIYLCIDLFIFISKGWLISKCLFDILKFFQKNKRKNST